MMTRDASQAPASRAGKKTEMIEVRVSHETKRDFLDACRREGRTVSDVVREAIDGYVSGAGRVEQQPERAPLSAWLPERLRRKRYIAAGLATLGLTAFLALPSAAQTDVVAAFDAMDRDQDGVVSLEEYAAAVAPGLPRSADRRR